MMADKRQKWVLKKGVKYREKGGADEKSIYKKLL
jgi:hypothetical protein